MRPGHVLCPLTIIHRLTASDCHDDIPSGLQCIFVQDPQNKIFALPSATGIRFCSFMVLFQVTNRRPSFPDILQSSLQQAAMANTARLPRLGQQMLDSITFAGATPILQNT